MKMALHIKHFIIIFMLFILGLCLLCFLKKFKKCRDFWKKKKKIEHSSLQNLSHWNLSLVCCRLNVYRSTLILRNQGLLSWKIAGYAPDMNQQSINRANVCLFKVNNRNSIKKCHWRCSGVFIVNFDHISHLSLA